MDCNGNIYNIGMGCCEPVLGPIENYYTKPTIDRMLDEITSAITSGCCITPEEVDEKIDEAISGISVSGVTEEELNEAIASAKTEIEGEIPSLDGYATEQWVEDKHYITGVDLSDYALKSEIPVVPTSNTAFTNDAGYLTEHQSLSGYATEAFVSAFTYDKATIDEKVAGGGSFDPSQYYNKTATDELLAEKLDVTAYTPVDLSNYYTTGETVNLVESAVTRVEDEIPTVPTSNTAFTNDAGYLTEHQSLSGYATEQWVEDKHYITGVDLSNYATKAEIPVVPTDISAFNNDVGYITGVDLSNYATKDNLTAATDDMATKTWVGQQGYLTEHQSLTAYSTTEQVNSAITQAVSGKQDTLISGTNIKTINNESLLGSGNITIQGGGATYTAGTGIDITNDVISTTLPITTGTGLYSVVVATTDNQYKPTASGSYSYAEGKSTSATGNTAHAEGNTTKAYGAYSHAEGYNSTASNDAAHAEGEYTSATGNSSHAEGYNTKAYGAYSHAEGNNAIASGHSSHAEGNQTKANGKFSHAEGTYTTAIGDDSHAEGSNTTAVTLHSHAEGAYTKANQMYAHAEGRFTVANGYYSHAEGNYTVTYNDSEHASGEYNVSNTGSTDADKTLFSVGNGTQSSRHNAFEVRKNGDVYVTSGGTDVKLQDHLGGGGTAYSAGTGIDITDNVISSTLPLSAGTGSKSIIEGYHVNIASGAASHAEGLYTEAKNIAEHASGMYNVSHTGNTTAASTLFSVGNGDENTRRNAFEIRQNGDIYIRKNNTDVRLQDITPGIWCGTMAEYQQISGSTDNNTIYLIHS